MTVDKSVVDFPIDGAPFKRLLSRQPFWRHFSLSQTPCGRRPHRPRAVLSQRGHTEQSGYRGALILTILAGLLTVLNAPAATEQILNGGLILIVTSAFARVVNERS